MAERAGVSKSLVSLVLRGSPHVSEHRRQAVLQAARELGYRPNAVARSLVEGRTHLIGALVADLHNPFYAEFLDGLQESLHGDGLRMLIGSGRWDPAFEDEAVEAFLELRVDGLVLLGVAPTSETLIEATGLHARRSSWASVTSSSTASTSSSTTTSSAPAWPSTTSSSSATSGSPTSRARRRPPRATAARATWWRCAGTRWRRTSWSSPATSPRRAAGARRSRLLTRDPRPTAIFAANDLVAIGVLSAAAELGLRVPEDLSVVGYDNTHLAADPATSR